MPLVPPCSSLCIPKRSSPGARSIILPVPCLPPHSRPTSPTEDSMSLSPGLPQPTALGLCAPFCNGLLPLKSHPLRPTAWAILACGPPQRPLLPSRLPWFSSHLFLCSFSFSPEECRFSSKKRGKPSYLPPLLSPSDLTHIHSFTYHLYARDSSLEFCPGHRPTRSAAHRTLPPGFPKGPSKSAHLKLTVIFFPPLPNPLFFFQIRGLANYSLRPNEAHHLYGPQCVLH